MPDEEHFDRWERALERLEDLWRRMRRDRLMLWTTLASAPVLWFSFALVDARFLVLVPLIAIVLAAWVRYGPGERFEPEPDDFIW